MAAARAGGHGVLAVPETPARGEAGLTLTWGLGPVSESYEWDGDPGYGS